MGGKEQRSGWKGWIICNSWPDRCSFPPVWTTRWIVIPSKARNLMYLYINMINNCFNSFNIDLSFKSSTHVRLKLLIRLICFSLSFYYLLPILILNNNCNPGEKDLPANFLFVLRSKSFTSMLLIKCIQPMTPLWSSPIYLFQIFWVLTFAAVPL
jgi:hypothetical protein